MFFRRPTRIVEPTAQRRVPPIFLWKEYAEAGGPMAYGPNLLESFRRAATYVEKSRPLDAG
jgi:hypothetical protein